LAKRKSNNLKITPLRAAMLILLLVGIYYLLPQLGSFHKTSQVLIHSSWLWVLVGVVASALTFLSGAVTQYAAGDSTGKFSDITLLQFAGSFVDHFLPFSLGALGMNTEYYHRHGHQRTRSLAIAIIPTVFGVITTLLLVLIISPVTLIKLDHGVRDNPKIRIATIIIGICVVIGLLALPLYKKYIRNSINQALLGFKALRSIKQTAIIFGGSLAITLFSSIALYTSIEAVHAHMAIVGVLVLYITAALVSNVAPTPGGLGATEAALIIGMTSGGLTLAEAVACTLIYRFVTFWLPLIPGGYALHQVNKKNLISD